MSRVLLAMSGGVDSSAAAVLLRRAGHEVTGVFMRHGRRPEPEGARPGKQGCCSLDDAFDARRVADRLGIPFYTLDFGEDFSRIETYFVEEYDRGATPNPCIVCNRDLKFGRLFDYADAIGADHVATGHYARVERRGERWALRKGVDEAKDQSYVLFPLGQDRLARAWFPAGAHRKTDLRRLAEEAGLGVAAKPESMEICFVPDNDHRRLLRERLGERVRPGEFRDGRGRLLGAHEGHQLFTVGQRRGLGAAFGRPMFVSEIRAEENVVVLSEEDPTASRFRVRDVNWISVPPGAYRASVKVRSMAPGAEARVEADGEGGARVEFERPQRAVTRGQAAVFYDGDVVLGGGWIV
jgi:tRNA-specific 2-thiouridylase